MEKGETAQRDNYNDPHNMGKESVYNKSRPELTEIPKDLGQTHRLGPGGTLEHPDPDPNGHHHMVTKLYSGFDGGGISSAPAGVPTATASFDQMASGAIGVLVDNIIHGHNRDGTIDLSGCKGAVIAHWPEGTTSDGTYSIYYDMSQAVQQTPEALEFLLINLRLRVDTFRQWKTVGASLTAAQPETPAAITIIETERTSDLQPITEINIDILGDVTVEGHGGWDRGPKVWWDPTPWGFAY